LRDGRFGADEFDQVNYLNEILQPSLPHFSSIFRLNSSIFRLKRRRNGATAQRIKRFMETEGLFFQAFVYLLAAVATVPIAKALGLGSVLGYLLAGVVIGPHLLGLVGQEFETAD
jgi:hypothetical protein